MKQTYLKTVALGIDYAAAAILLNRNDFTISTAAGLVQLNADAPLQLHAWQRRMLAAIGAALDYFWPGHCEGAIHSDRARARVVVEILSQALKVSSHDDDLPR